MHGIDLNKPILYKHSSLRFFAEHEWHIDRLCEDDVLLLVFDGVLRFSEDGVMRELGAGEYYIQRRGGLQKGERESDTPRYLYVHFHAEWGEGEGILPFCGAFDVAQLEPMMKKMDRLAHGDYTYTERNAVFTALLSQLFGSEKPRSTADEVAAFMETHLQEPLSLERLGAEFHFSKNHLINLFKRAFGVTPTQYWNRLKLQKAKHLLEVTSDSAATIAEMCGFGDYSHFYRLFLRETGLSPIKWREQLRERGIS